MSKKEPVVPPVFYILIVPMVVGIIDGFSTSLKSGLSISLFILIVCVMFYGMFRLFKD